MISLILCTYRPGGFDLFAQSFAGLESDYEVVIVDDYPGRVERGTVPKFFNERGIKLGWYGPSKPKSYPAAKGGLCNAWNTAVSHARGDYLVFISDYCFLPTNWLSVWEAMRRHWRDKVLVSGSALIYDAPKPEDKDIESGIDPDRLGRPKWPWVAWEFETFYVGFPLQFFIDTNGIDERADHCHCWPVSSQVAQARILGYRLVVISELCCYMVDHRAWDNKEQPAPLGCGDEGLWRITDKRSFPDEPTWVVPSPNPFNLLEMRKENEL